jgi:hypothetical protein
MTTESLPSVNEQISPDVQKTPGLLMPWKIQEILNQRWGNPNNAEDILAIQEWLHQLGYAPGALDGVFKEKNAITLHTIEALRDFQKKNGLTVDWQPWKQTLAKMLDVLNAKIAQPSSLGGVVDKSQVNPKRIPPSPIQKSVLESNIRGIGGALSMLLPGSFFLKQMIDNLGATFSKPKDDLHHGKDSKTAILIPWFLCNQGVMEWLGKKLSRSMNIVYPDIGANEQLVRSLPELADKITQYVIDLENKGLLKKDGEYTIIGHSMGGSLALLVTKKLRARHIIQISTPNSGPDVAKISWLGYIPVLFDLRGISSQYATVRPISPIWRLTNITGENDLFIGTGVQWSDWIPPNIQINRVDPAVFLKWGHIDPIVTDAGINRIADIANSDK